MMGNENLHRAKVAKNDEFYTQYQDIQSEVNAYIEYDENVFRDKTVLLPCDDPEWSNFTKFFAQNFEKFGLKKLISTSYAYDSKTVKGPMQLTMFEIGSPLFDEKKTSSHGKIFVLDRDRDESGRIDVNDLEWKYLEGDGDFRSKEVTALRDEADIIVTNPPFSLFREFLAWITAGKKKFLIIGNKGAATYKDFFPLIKDNKVWSGATPWGTLYFMSPDKSICDAVIDGEPMKSVPAVWFTNLEHGRRHKPLNLMSSSDNIRYSKHKETKDAGYKRYDNYDAINIPYVEDIPSDYKGMMGVPVTFLDKYCPEQFEIIGAVAGWNDVSKLVTKKYVSPQIQFDEDGKSKAVNKLNDGVPLFAFDNTPESTYYTVGDDKYYVRAYSRIFIRYTSSWIASHPEDFK